VCFEGLITLPYGRGSEKQSFDTLDDDYL